MYEKLFVVITEIIYMFLSLQREWDLIVALETVRFFQKTSQSFGCHRTDYHFARCQHLCNANKKGRN